MVKRILCPALLVCAGLILTGAACTPEGGGAGDMLSKPTLEAAIEKAKARAKELGYDVEAMRVEADDANTTWTAYVKKIPTVLESEPVKAMALDTREFWAIHLTPQKLRLGGGMWVFVDKSSGEIVGVLRGR